MALPLGGEQVALQHEAPHESRSRAVHQLLGAGALVQPARLQHGHAVADGQGLLGVVGHDHAAGTAAGQHTGQLGPQPQAHLHVEVGEGFVQQHQGAAGGQGPGQGQALPLAAGKLMGVALFEPLEAQQLQQPSGTAAVLAAPQPETGIPPGVEVGEQGVVLKHHAHAAALGRQPALGPRHLLAADSHHPTVGALKAGDQPQQGGLAATGRAQQAHQFPRTQLEVDVPQRPVAAGGGAAVAMPQAAQLHLRPQGQLSAGLGNAHPAGSP